MIEFFHEPFKNFCPITGKVPEIFNDDFHYIATKARKILKDRTREEIDFGMQTVNWIMDRAELEFSPILNVFEFKEIGIDEETGETILVSEGKKNSDLKPSSRYYNSPASQFLEMIGKFDISNQYDFPNAVQAEYFAILALGFIDVAVQIIDDAYVEQEKLPIEKQLSNMHIISMQVLKAMEAISFGEMFYLNKAGVTPEKKAKELISLKNSTAAIKRHGPTNEIKAKFVKFYRSDEYPSIAEAIRRFFKTLSDQEKSLLHHDAKERDRFFRRALKDLQSENNEK